MFRSAVILPLVLVGTAVALGTTPLIVQEGVVRFSVDMHLWVILRRCLGWSVAEYVPGKWICLR
jgi:hypothetical protein